MDESVPSHQIGSQVSIPNYVLYNMNWLPGDLRAVYDLVLMHGLSF